MQKNRNLPIIVTESIIFIYIINAEEKRNIVVIGLLNTFIETYMKNKKILPLSIFEKC